MLPIIGMLLVFVLVFGGYVLAGGKFQVILHSLPFELMMIGGGSTGGFIVANSGVVIKAVLKGFGKVFKGAKYKKNHYIELLCLMFTIIKTMKMKGLIALEAHIENPEESDIFKQYPDILADHHVVHFICDTLRLLTMNFENPYQVEDMLVAQLEKHHHEELAPASALQTVADGLPAIGIVAAVLGVIKTMASVTEPPEILGKMIAGALVGTFLGVFLAYCFVGPMATKMNSTIEEESAYFNVIKQIIISYLQGHAPQVAVEIARGVVPGHIQPSFAELDETINSLGSTVTASED